MQNYEKNHSKRNLCHHVLDRNFMCASAAGFGLEERFENEEQ
jgi:hypothetical protein